MRTADLLVSQVCTMIFLLICGKIIVATTMSAIMAQFPQLMTVIHKRPHLQASLQSVGTYTVTDNDIPEINSKFL